MKADSNNQGRSITLNEYQLYLFVCSALYYFNASECTEDDIGDFASGYIKDMGDADSIEALISTTYGGE
jgi:hypothetical protein